MRHKVWGAAAVAVLAVALAACGGDDGGETASTTTALVGTSTTVTDTASTAPTSTAPTSTTLAPVAQPSTTTSTASAAPDAFGVGQMATTFTDPTRPTPASRDQPATDTRVLDTVIWYPTNGDPADGTVPDAEPASGPFPLIVFAHGLGGDPENIEDVADDWTRAGFVVAAPRFPLSRSDHPGGPDAGDVQNQTGDISFLITTLSDDATTPLPAGVVDGEHVGVAGHSNGAITTLGVTAHSCCRDERIDAAVEMAGTPSPFGGGDYDFTQAPAYLIVHGTADPLVNYANAVELFNSLLGPKGLLTITGGDHGGYLGESGVGHDDVATVTTTFWRAYLRGDSDAFEQLAGETTTSPEVELRMAAQVGSTETIDTVAPAVDREVAAEPTTGLTGGQQVTVTWSGFLPGGTINVVQCSQGGTEGSGACDLTTGVLLRADPTGAGSVELTIVAGPVGDGQCGPETTDCVIIVNDSGLADPAATIRIPLTFAG